MTPIHRNWSAVRWTRPEYAALDPASDDGEPPVLHLVEVPGAEVTDHERGITYRVTVSRRDGRAMLRTLELAPHDGEVSRDTLREVPAANLAAFVAQFVDEYTATRAAAATPGQGRPDNTVRMFGAVGRGGARLEGQVPTSEDVAKLRREGYRRADIAKLYGRAPSTVSDWITRAYAEVPDLMPPRERGRGAGTRGPASSTKTTDADRPSAR